MPAGAGPPITDHDRQRVRALHAAGWTRNDIAKELGRSGSTISKIAAELGLGFDRKSVAAATEARRVDAKARRVALMHDLLDDANRLRKQMWTPCTIHAFGGRDNVYNSKKVDQPPFREQRDIMYAAGIAIEKSLRLDDHDGDAGADDAKSMIGALAAGLTEAYKAINEDETAGPSDEP